MDLTLIIDAVILDYHATFLILRQMYNDFQLSFFSRKMGYFVATTPHQFAVSSELNPGIDYS